MMLAGESTAKPQSYNILLIEEDPKQTELYSDLLREVADCRVDVISGVENAFKGLGKINYHLVVIDLSFQSSGAMPQEFDSLAVLERIRRTSPMTSVILMSDHATVEEAVTAIRMGAEDYFKKPFNLESFQLAVKRGLDRKIVFDENSSASSYVNLLNSCQMISGSLEQEKIFEIVQSYFGRELHVNYSVIYTTQNDHIQMIKSRRDSRRDRGMEEILDIALQANNPLLKMAAANEPYRFLDRGQLTPGLFIFRFRCVGDSDFFCVCLSPEKPLSLEAFESRIKMLRTQIEVTGKNIAQYMGVQHLVYVDDVTGLYNTRYLNHILDREISQAQSAQRSFAVLFVDADKFKGVNDSHGHLVGSRLLNELGNQLKKYLRETDTVFRYGGDEFVAVLSPCDLATAKAVAERIRKSVETRRFLAREGLNIHFTVSIGVALFPDHADSKKAIIDAADQAMYSAKRATRNSVFIAEVRPNA